MASKKRTNLSNHLYQKNKLSNLSETLLKSPVAAAAPPPQQKAAQPPPVAHTKFDDIMHKIEDLYKVIEFSQQSQPDITSKLEELYIARSQIENLCQTVQQMETSRAELCQTVQQMEEKHTTSSYQIKNLYQTVAKIQEPAALSTNYTIETNTLFLPPPENITAPFFIKLKDGDIKRLIMHTSSERHAPTQPYHYQYKFYIKRRRYAPKVFYIDVEQIETDTVPPQIIPLNKCGSGAGATSALCIKPSVNSEFIIQTIDLFYDPEGEEWSGFQSISEQ